MCALVSGRSGVATRAAQTRSENGALSGTGEGSEVHHTTKAPFWVAPWRVSASVTPGGRLLCAAAAGGGAEGAAGAAAGDGCVTGVAQAASSASTRNHPPGGVMRGIVRPTGP